MFVTSRARHVVSQALDTWCSPCLCGSYVIKWKLQRLKLWKIHCDRPRISGWLFYWVIVQPGSTKAGHSQRQTWPKEGHGCKRFMSNHRVERHLRIQTANARVGVNTHYNSHSPNCRWSKENPYQCYINCYINHGKQHDTDYFGDTFYQYYKLCTVDTSWW